MWIFENEGEALEGKRLWLRPGKRYLFGRTVAEPGQLAIRGPGAEKVSRKHVTIAVDPVEEGDAENMESRSRVTVEDLGSKGGTKVNDQKYKGQTCVLSQDSNSLQMGSFPTKFRITWFPVVLSFSFTSHQLRADPVTPLRQHLEQLDVKLLTDYNVQLTTHVVSKKRNTSKGLQALINGKYIVSDAFVDALVTAATPEQSDDGVATSSLESDFDGSWPDAMKYLPPPGEEPVPRPTEAFAPNPTRAELFDGYTFIFYKQSQFESLLAPITNGKGKALLQEVVAFETELDDFIRYVKGIAGEKGLGEFEDGSEGKGVVVVKWMPPSGPEEDWFAEFFRSISLRLDHRLISQKEFLDAILSNDAIGLRRPLEIESQDPSTQTMPISSTDRQSMDVDQGEPIAEAPRPPPRRTRREPVKSRFRGFGHRQSESSSSEDEAPASAPTAPQLAAANVESSQEGLFVTQEVFDEEFEEHSQPAPLQQRKRPAPADMIDDFAPTAAQIKRRRIAAGEDPVSRREPTPAVPAAVESPRPSKSQAAKAKKELDVLELARQHREEAEKRAQAERAELEAEPGDLDLAQIRRLHLEEEMPLRQVPTTARTREEDVAAGRWDPAWNGRRNFKKFRQRGAAQGRPPEKIIVALEEVRTKGFGIGDDYWLEDGSGSHSQQQRGGKKKQQQQLSSQSQSAAAKESHGTQQKKKRTQAQKKRAEQLLQLEDSSDEEDEDGERRSDARGQEGGEDEDEDEDGDPVVASRARRGGSSSRAAGAKSTQASSSSAARPVKRPAAAAKGRQQPPSKRAKIIQVQDSDDDDDSDDGLRFRFGKR
ncbi:hypothetical protein GGR56DRAFT_666725 [Xylariaceae sp. FL0804]|nr:hypothetical protein GGR56DRAFT_666725 [Xylariaceae sp. FL0804]